MKYSDTERIKKIYRYSTLLNEYISEKHITKADLLSDIALQWLVTTPLYNIGEHASQLSKEYKAKHEQIAWNMMAGLRHRLVHDYDGTNWNIIADVVFEELPIFIEQLRTLQETDAEHFHGED